MTPVRRVLITGGAGFVGSNLCERFLSEGWHVIVVDNSITGTGRNLVSFVGRPEFSLVEGDVSEPMKIDEDLDLVLHFASLASPIQ